MTRPNSHHVPTRNVLFLCIPPIIELDQAGPLSVFTLAQTKGMPALAPGEVHYRVTVATVAADRAMAGHCGLQLLAQKHYLDVVNPVDTLIVVGSSGSLEYAAAPELCEWLRSKSSEARRTASICLGAFFLAAAGLLDGKRAATHWAYAEELQRKYPRLEVDSERIWVVDGSIYTSAGVSAGIDWHWRSSRKIWEAR